MQLARFHGSSRLLHIEELARMEEVPQNYLVQILNELRNGGLVQSKRGKQGGYALASHPDSVTIKSIVEVMDPDMIATSVSQTGESGALVAQAWDDLSRSFFDGAQQISIQEILSRETGDSYCI